MSTATAIAEPARSTRTTRPRVQAGHPYLFFHGRCEEAIRFYQKTLGAEVLMMMRFKESPEPCAPQGGMPEEWQTKIMHAHLRVGATEVMVSDGCWTQKSGFEGFSLALTVATAADVDPLFNGLADGGKIEIPLDKTFWSPRFGAVEDRFGVGWMIMAQSADQK